MPVSNLAFFHPVVLHQQFQASAQQLVDEQHINEAQRQALIELVEHPHDLARGRYDRFVPPEQRPVPASIQGALLLNLADSPVTYLFTPMYGLEVFADRKAFIQALRQRGADTDGGSLELIERSPFTVQSDDYLSQRAENLTHTATLLGQMPTFSVRLSSGSGNGLAPGALAVLDAFWAESENGQPRQAALQQTYREGFYQAWLAARALYPSAPVLQACPQRDGLHFARILLAQRHAPGATVSIPVSGALMAYLPEQPQRCLYTPHGGVILYANEQVMMQALANGAPSLLGVPAYGQASGIHDRQRDVLLQPIEAEPVAIIVADILSAQRVEVLDALQRAEGVAEDSAMILLENALDIRPWLDGRLTRVDPLGRWVDLIVDPALVPPDPDAIPESESQVAVELGVIADCRAGLGMAQPSIESVVETVLAPWLTVLDPTLIASHIRLESADHQALTLSQLYLQRYTGASPAPLDTLATVQWVDRDPVPGLDIPWLERLLGNTVQRFAAAYTQQVARLYQPRRRLNQRSVDTTRLMRDTLIWVLRAELMLAIRERKLPTSLLALLQQAIGNSQAVQAFGMDLEWIDGPHKAVRFADVAVLRTVPTLSETSADNQSVLFWSGALGLQIAPSMEALAQRILQDLSSRGRASQYLNMFAIADGARIRAIYEMQPPLAPTITFWPMDGDLLHRLHKSAHGRTVEQCGRVLRLVREQRCDADTAAAVLDAVARDDSLGGGIGRLAQAWVNHLARAVLPAWVLNASKRDQRTFFDYLRGCAQVASPSQDYLEGMPTLEAFAQQAVARQLVEDGFSATLDPAHVKILSRAYIAAPVAIGSLPSAIPAAVREHQLTLVEAALQPNAWLRESLQLSLDGGGELPAGLTPLYVRALVRKLDCGAQYRRLLERTLSHDSPDFGKRRDRFTEQLRRHMLMTAFALKLEASLTAQGFAMVECLAQAPDAQARSDAGLDAASIARLRLRAAPGWDEDALEGVYCLADGTVNGPVVLFLLYARQAALIEYANEGALLQALSEDAELQAQLLERVDPDRRGLYEDGGLARPHVNRFLPEAITDLGSHVAPAQWVFAPVTGNLFHALYDDNLNLLRSLAKAQTVTAEQARWQDFRYLIALAVEQGSMFLPMPFAAVIALWQSRQLVGASVAAGRARKWGEALSEMLAAMASLLSLNHATGPGELPVAPQTARMEFTWHFASELPADLRGRLAAMEVNTVDLAQLQVAAPLPLYRDGDQHYASVEGKVFRVALRDERWFILDRDQRWGPALRLGEHNRWRLDLGLYGGGQATSCYRREPLFESLRSEFTVTETGLRQMRRFKPGQAAQLEASLVHAQQVLHRAASSLDVHGQLPLVARRILEDTFGPGQVTPTLVKRVHGLIDRLYTEAVSTGLRKGNRWVVGSAAPGNHNTIAFTVAADPKRRIFLADSFFDASTVSAVSEQAIRAGFDPLRYLQSTVLIHELSHSTLNTEDLAYLGLETPYIDLVDPMYWRARGPIVQAQRRQLCHDTPQQRLFSDLAVAQAATSNGERVALARLYQLTGAADLPAVVTVYQTNAAVRNEIILANADSLTWLVLQLGRVDPLLQSSGAGH